VKETMSGRSRVNVTAVVSVAVLVGFATLAPTRALPADKKPNILVIMGGDDVGFNVEPYHQGIMSGRTPNLMRLAREGVRFTDDHAEASCTAEQFPTAANTGSSPTATGKGTSS
jgi:hypothetical protein